MTTRGETTDGELFEELLELDRRYRAGDTPPVAESGRAELRETQKILDILEEVWPRNKKPASAAAPQVVGRFHVVRELGRGGSGMVYLARDTRLGRLVALNFPGSKRSPIPNCARASFARRKPRPTWIIGR